MTERIFLFTNLKIQQARGASVQTKVQTRPYTKVNNMGYT